MKTYERAELQVIFFEADDILTGSPNFENQELTENIINIGSEDEIKPN